MYGLIHSALKEMITEQHGEELWNEILEKSGAPTDSFLDMRSYSDDITFALVGATSERLGAPVDTCLELFGEFWLTRFAPKSYDSLLEAAGGNLFEFLENLDALHDRISTTFVGYVPPSFGLVRHSSTTGTLNYISARKGMLPFVLGIIKGMQERFNVDISFDSIEQTSSAKGDRASINLTLVYRS